MLEDCFNCHNDPAEDFTFDKLSIATILYTQELFGVEADDDEDGTDEITDNYDTVEDAVDK